MFICWWIRWWIRCSQQLLCCIACDVTWRINLHILVCSMITVNVAHNTKLFCKININTACKCLISNNIYMYMQPHFGGLHVIKSHLISELLPDCASCWYMWCWGQTLLWVLLQQQTIDGLIVTWSTIATQACHQHSHRRYQNQYRDDNGYNARKTWKKKRQVKIYLLIM